MDVATSLSEMPKMMQDHYDYIKTTRKSGTLSAERLEPAELT